MTHACEGHLMLLGVLRAPHQPTDTFAMEQLIYRAKEAAEVIAALEQRLSAATKRAEDMEKLAQAASDDAERAIQRAKAAEKLAGANFHEDHGREMRAANAEARAEAAEQRAVEAEALLKAGRHAFNDVNPRGKTILDFMNVWLDQERARAVEAEKRAGELAKDNKFLTDEMDAAVQEQIVELDAEGEAFNKECWAALRSLCENMGGFDWSDWPDGVTAQGAYDYLDECFREERRATQAAEKRAEEAERENKRLREVLADANNKWRHEFSAAVEQAADKLFARLSWQHTVKQNPGMAEKVK